MIINSRASRHLAVNCVAACLPVLFVGCQQRKEAETETSAPEIVIDRLVLGRLQTNCYCLRAATTAKDCLIMDTGADHVEPLIDFLKENSLEPAAVIFTHGHFDHVNGVTLLCEHFPRIRAVIHKADGAALAGKVKESRIHFVEKDGPIEFAGIKLEVFHTPGHTPGGISLYLRCRGVVFTGDSLFAGSVGRTDLEDGSFKELIKGIKEKLLVLAEETVVYPGHGPSTTIGKEKRSNQYLR